MGKSSKRKAAGVLPDDMEDKEWELVAPNRHEVIIKRSRFIAFAGPVNTTTEALAFIEASSERDARHNCWAYLLDGQEFRCNDDGEPGGTAGRPILAAIENSKVVNVAVCVVRYFGGIKLGAGGLVRAYGGVTRDCLKEAQKRVKIRMEEMLIESDFQDIGSVINVVKGYCKVESKFNEQGATIFVRVPVEKVEQFKQAINDASKGRAAVKSVDSDNT